ncbi:MAG: glycosyltransferase, partial [Acidobacteriota bacterium]
DASVADAAGAPSGARPRVGVCLVTHNDADDLPDCFAAVRALRHRPLDVVVADCASGDDSVARARAFAAAMAGAEDVRVIVRPLGRNRGFAGGMNAAFAATDAPFLLTLNADAHPAPDYLDRLLRHAVDADARVGAVTGRLTRPPDSGGARRLDACGMFLIRSWRHLDRGSGEVDRGQYATPARVFGGTGAATLWVRRALDDVAFPPALVDPDDRDAPAVFDPDFHTFREDAELAFRLQARGWDAIYEPSARAVHRRSNLPGRRQRMPAFINRHTLKNRYLLRAYHQTARNALATLAPTLVRDALALGYVLLCERTSLGAYAWLWRHRARLRARRRWLMARKTHALAPWFARDQQPLCRALPRAAAIEPPAD